MLIGRVGRDRRHRVAVTVSLLLGLLGTLLGCVAALSTKAEAAAAPAGSVGGGVVVVTAGPGAAADVGSGRGAGSVGDVGSGRGAGSETDAGSDRAGGVPGTGARASGVRAGGVRDGDIGVRTGAGGPAEAVAAGAAELPGCGQRTGAGDSGAHPGVPPRGGTAYELLPVLHQTHGFGGTALVCDQTVLDVSPLRGPPPLAPPSAVDLSVLRV